MAREDVSGTLLRHHSRQVGDRPGLESEAARKESRNALVKLK